MIPAAAGLKCLVRVQKKYIVSCVIGFLQLTLEGVGKFPLNTFCALLALHGPQATGLFRVLAPLLDLVRKLYI